jgi:hypothetical protein
MSKFKQSLTIIGLKPNNLLITLVVVGVITGGNIWLHRNDTPLGMVQYSEYGFTFTHESGGYAWLGSDVGRTQSYSTGSYGVSFESEDYLEIGIYWFTSEMIPVSADESILEASLKMKFEAWESLWEARDAQFLHEDDFVFSEKDGHDMIYTVTVISDSWGDEPIIFSAWQCGERIFIFYTRYVEDVETWEVDIGNLTEVWNQQLDQLKCH